MLLHHAGAWLYLLECLSEFKFKFEFIWLEFELEIEIGNRGRKRRSESNPAAQQSPVSFFSSSGPTRPPSLPFSPAQNLNPAQTLHSSSAQPFSLSPHKPTPHGAAPAPRSPEALLAPPHALACASPACSSPGPHVSPRQPLAARVSRSPFAR